MAGPWQPERGDFVFLDFTPQSGTEQAGHRPALVLSPRKFNVGTGLAFVCPVTSKGTGSNFEVAVPRGAKLHGYILTHQLRSVDWLARRARHHSRADEKTMDEVLARIAAVLEV